MEKNKALFIKEDDKQIIEQIAQQVTSNDDSPWFRCGYSDFVNYSDFIGSFYNHPFIDPLLYDRLHELKVDLYAFTGSNDFLLDHSIELARVWKGGKCLEL